MYDEDYMSIDDIMSSQKGSRLEKSPLRFVLIGNAGREANFLSFIMPMLTTLSQNENESEPMYHYVTVQFHFNHHTIKIVLYRRHLIERK